jgi:hypothetical protein
MTAMLKTSPLVASPAPSAARKILVGGLAALTMMSGLVAAVPTAEARDGRNAALIGGLAAGAVLGGVIAQASRAPAYGQTYGYGGGYYEARPQAYYAAPQRYYPAAGYSDSSYYTAPTYVQECFRERRPVFDAWGEVVGFRRVRVCR